MHLDEYPPPFPRPVVTFWPVGFQTLVSSPLPFVQLSRPAATHPRVQAQVDGRAFRTYVTGRDPEMAVTLFPPKECDETWWCTPGNERVPLAQRHGAVPWDSAVGVFRYPAFPRKVEPPCLITQRSAHRHLPFLCSSLWTSFWFSFPESILSFNENWLRYTPLSVSSTHTCPVTHDPRRSPRSIYHQGCWSPPHWITLSHTVTPPQTHRHR